MPSFTGVPLTAIAGANLEPCPALAVTVSVTFAPAAGTDSGIDQLYVLWLTPSVHVALPPFSEKLQVASRRVRGHRP